MKTFLKLDKMQSHKFEFVGCAIIVAYNKIISEEFSKVKFKLKRKMANSNTKSQRVKWFFKHDH